MKDKDWEAKQSLPCMPCSVLLGSNKFSSLLSVCSESVWCHNSVACCSSQLSQFFIQMSLMVNFSSSSLNVLNKWLPYQCCLVYFQNTVICNQRADLTIFSPFLFQGSFQSTLLINFLPFFAIFTCVFSCLLWPNSATLLVTCEKDLGGNNLGKRLRCYSGKICKRNYVLCSTWSWRE